MVQLASLWLPIVLSAVAVFFASSIVWMVLPIHKNDYKMLKDKEDAVMAAVRSWGLGPGMYWFPGCEHGKKPGPEVVAKQKSGPWGVLTLMPGCPNMGKMLGMWMLNLLIVTTLIGYAASRGMAPGTAYMKVFQVVGVIALLAYAGSALCDSIWKGRPWSHVPGAVIDGVIYAGITAGMFGWLWPSG